MSVFKYIVAKYFFQDYAPNVKQYKHKMRGTDGNGKPIEFTEADQKEIKAGIKKLFQNLMKPPKTPQGVGKRGQKNNTK